MRKHARLLSLVLVLVMALLPMCAHAETIEVKAYQLRNPVVKMNDETMLDLSGLTLQVSGGENAEGTLAQLFLDIIANDEFVTSGVIQIDESNILAFLSGMASAYKLPMSVFSGAATEMNSFMDMLSSWTLPGEIIAVFQDFSENGMVMGEPATDVYENETATYNMTYVPFTADLTPYIVKIKEIIDADELIGKLKGLSGDALDAADDAANAISEIAITLEGEMGMDDTGVITTVEMTVKAVEGENTASIMYSFVMDASDPDDVVISGTVYNPDDQDNHVEFSGTVAGDSFSMDVMAIDDTTGDITMGIVMSMRMAGGENADQHELFFDMNMGDAGRYVFSSAYNMTTGAFHVGYDGYTDAVSVTLYADYAPDAATAEGFTSSGKVELGYSDGTTVYTLLADTASFTTEVDSESFFNASTEAIDLTAMTEEQSSAAMTEISQVLYNTLAALEEKIPSLTGITESLFGVSDVETEVPAE